MKGKNKDEKFENAINDFLFTETGSFDKWFFALPPVSRRILYAVVFEAFVGIEELEKALNSEIKLQNEKWSYIKRMDASYNLDFLVIYSESYNGANTSYKKKSICINELFRAAIMLYLVPPPEALLENCVSAEMPAESVYNNAADILETIPLFCGVLNEIFKEEAEKKNLLQSFNKKTIGRVYAASGLRPFPLETEKAAAAYSPSAADMLGRFILFSVDFPMFARPEKPLELIRALFKQFLNLPEKTKNKNTRVYRSGFENSMFFPHISKNYSSSQYFFTDEAPEVATRRALYECLLTIAKDGRAFDACALIRQLKYTAKSLSFFPRSERENLKLKADTVNLDGNEFRKPQWGHLTPAGRLCFEFLEKPLFLGYFYLCASLGILEITQAEPPLICERAGKKTPVSVFNGLKTIKITEFGRWCMGLSDQPPKFEKNKYEAIADNELLLVTVRGKSLERTLFLDGIGEKLGPDRWRVNAATFLSGCENKSQIEERIKKFHNLIESAPAPHWEALFKTVLERAELFDRSAVNALVYRLPFGEPYEREAVAELLSDPELGDVAMRAEGGVLVVYKRNEKRFYALLASHGIAHFTAPKPL
jgi:hypothetical protein